MAQMASVFASTTLHKALLIVFRVRGSFLETNIASFRDFFVIGVCDEASVLVFLHLFNEAGRIVSLAVHVRIVDEQSPHFLRPWSRFQLPLIQPYCFFVLQFLSFFKLVG